MSTVSLYFLTTLIACVVTAGSLPFLHHFLAKYFLDTPNHLKKHIHAIPVLGGSAIFLGLAASLIFIRLTTAFPTGTLHSLRGVLIGAGMIFLLGLADDLKKPRGISVSVKLAVQALATAVLMYYGIRITLFDSALLCYAVTFFWIVGLTNAFNLLDIQDGLCVSQAVIAALGLALIALPTEVIYVNFAAWAMIGACCAFWPYNHAKRLKTFLGDSGSMLLGFLLAALACGMGYSEHSHLGFLTPLFILAIPIFDTLFAIIRRIIKGQPIMAPDRGHLHHRLIDRGFSHKSTVIILYGLSAILAISAIVMLITDVSRALILIASIVLFGLFAFTLISRNEEGETEEVAQETEKKEQ